MKAFRRSMDLCGAAAFRNYEFYVTVCKAPDNKPGEDVWLAYIPDLGIATEGYGREDAYDMARDAGSMTLDLMKPWARPGCGRMYASEALQATKEAYPDIDISAWEFNPVQMELPYTGWGNEVEEE